MGTSKVESTLSRFRKGPSRLWHIAERFPNLLELKIGRTVKRHFLGPSAPFELSDLAALPDSLVHLSLNIPFHGFRGDLSAILPLSLQILEVNRYVRFPLFKLFS